MYSIERLIRLKEIHKSKKGVVILKTKSVSVLKIKNEFKRLFGLEPLKVNSLNTTKNWKKVYVTIPNFEDFESYIV
jgi:ribosomal protein L23